jgi:hypothetical protein
MIRSVDPASRSTSHSISLSAASVSAVSPGAKGPPLRSIRTSAAVPVELTSIVSVFETVAASHGVPSIVMASPARTMRATSPFASVIVTVPVGSSKTQVTAAVAGAATSSVVPRATTARNARRAMADTIPRGIPQLVGATIRGGRCASPGVACCTCK